ncbi:hypothetical protein IEQ34_007382 [Dendrobium chrysotoxum]|uniref:non-specific serine/threonine protein kinase n=1 Tax=Dendrobium chrysotoxum TaxID=161865 RepID=A0AAV7H654_DENCH|nr:hypothetical protein IEQ34_007382 [Dendrobium chrysotoxum]
MQRPLAMTRRRDLHTKNLTFSLFQLFILLVLFTQEALCFSDRSSLLRFKSSVYDPSGLLATWSAGGADHCSWLGVHCDSRFRVVAVNISACPAFGRSCPDQTLRFAGQLPTALFDLTELQVLSLPFHAFFGEIPGEIWKLESLEVLDLEGNLISGSVPLRFPRGLRVLNLRSNQINGVIPFSLSSCLELETLELSGNQFNGTIPLFFDKMVNLRNLHLSFNFLSKSIPEEIGAGCWNLEHLDLSGNLLLGSIPHSLANCSKLRSLILFSNLLDGSVPSDFGRLKELEVLDVSQNRLSGVLPPELGNCTQLSVLILSNPYHPIRRKEDNENKVNIDDFNCFEGGIPDSITSLPNLRMLWAPRVSLKGDISSNWGTCETLEIINLGENLLTGQIPTVFRRCQNLKFLNLSSNMLSGSVGEELSVSCMDVFDVSENQLSGSIPVFVNKTCGLPKSHEDDHLLTYVSYFLSGARAAMSFRFFEPTSSFIVYHNFGGNNFTGNLPTFPLAADKFGEQIVYAFLIDRNQLVGPLMGSLFEKCNALQGLVLNFSSNLIHGGIPEKIGTLCKALMVFDASGNQITGIIPKSFRFAENLLSLDLSRNRLGGQIPAIFDNLKHLRFFSVASNNLSGQITSDLDQSASLEIVDLSFNSLTGVIPGGLVKLKNLTVLILDGNKLSGKLPNFSSLSMFNVSFNYLSDPLSFSSSKLSCDTSNGSPLLSKCPEVSLTIPPSYPQGLVEDSQTYNDAFNASLPAKSNNGFNSIEIGSISSASAIVSILLALIILYVYTRKCTPRSSQQTPGQREVTIFTDIGVPITYESVLRATGGFNASNCIGSGGFGATYKAEIHPGVVVAIKRLSIGRLQGVLQFDAEIKTLGRWRHPNLVTLIGYHLSDAEMFLIYNYFPGGNLERFIQERSKRPTDWRIFHKIAIDVARALAYLHDHCVPRILHRDVKPSNILLDNEYNAYLSDFGLARLLGNSETHATTGVAGTFGYVAPEYAMTCRVSDKADVYSYGVVLLELLSDKKALDPSFSPYGNGFNIVAWACLLLRQGRAREFFTDGLWGVGPRDDLVETLHLAVMCTVDSLPIRPTMKQVVQRLKQLQPPNY